MAYDSTIGGYDSYRDYLNNYKYQDTGSSTDKTSGTTETKVWNAVFEDEDKTAIDMDGFLKMMVTQMTNQDFMNPVDDTQFVTQMAQFSMMQYMSEMSANFKNNYMLELVGKDVTCAKFNVSGDLVKETGPVERIILADNDYSIYVNGQKFALSQIMEIGKPGETTQASEEDEAGENGEAEAAEAAGVE